MVAKEEPERELALPCKTTPKQYNSGESKLEKNGRSKAVEINLRIWVQDSWRNGV
jgi:hypothetical protein